jgi:hypothetical protein
MSSLEYLSITAFLAWSAFPKSPPIPWYWWSPSLPPNPIPDPPPYATLIGNVYYLSLAGLVLTTAATHPAEALSLRYGPFMLIPVVQIVAGLVGNNSQPVAAAKAKV